MNQHLSWPKAYASSFLIHILLLALLALGLSQVVAESEKNTYIVDLSMSDFSQGSGHAGGGSNEAAFPEPLKAEDVAKRVASVQEAQTFAKTATAQTPESVPLSPTAVPVPAGPAAPSASSGSDRGAFGAAGDTSGTAGGGAGADAGQGAATGDGRGSGEGTGSGEGSGAGEVQGRGSLPFDAVGFRAAVEANKAYPHMAIMRHLEGSVQLLCSISPSGAITSVEVTGSSGFPILDKAAASAVRAVGSYPNPTGDTVNVDITVHFNLE